MKEKVLDMNGPSQNINKLCNTIKNVGCNFLLQLEHARLSSETLGSKNSILESSHTCSLEKKGKELCRAMGD
jgi:hypothetical protein